MKFKGFKDPVKYCIYVANNEGTYNTTVSRRELQENESWGMFTSIMIIGETAKSWVYVTAEVTLFYNRDDKGLITGAATHCQRLKLETVAKGKAKGKNHDRKTSA